MVCRARSWRGGRSTSWPAAGTSCELRNCCRRSGSSSAGAWLVAGVGEEWAVMGVSSGEGWRGVLGGVSNLGASKGGDCSAV